MNVREPQPPPSKDWDFLDQFIDALNDEQEKLGMPNYASAHRATIRAALSGGHGGVYLAFDDDDRPVGFSAMLRFPTMPVGMVDGIGTYVLPRLRRTKVGHDLGKACERFHAKNGQTACWGTVHLKNHAAIARCFAEGAELVGLLLRYPLRED